MTASSSSHSALHGVRILSLALNLPGPAALMRLRAMGAQCTKVEGPQGDPMGHYSPEAYAQLHEGIALLTLNLKTPTDLAQLHTALAQTDVLLTSFRPSALRKLALDWQSLHHQHPKLAMVSIVGSLGSRAEEPGHDLTYMAEHGLVTGTQLPASLFADMAGAVMASEAVLRAVLQLKLQGTASHTELALSDAAAFLGLPRSWGITTPSGAVGGAHAGYRVYRCADGRVAVAALEPHFAKALCTAAGLAQADYASMLQPSTHTQLEAFFARHTCQQLSELAQQQDIPLHCLPP